MLLSVNCTSNKKLSYHRGSMRHSKVKIFSVAAQVYEKSHFKRPAIGYDFEDHSWTSE